MMDIPLVETRLYSLFFLLGAFTVKSLYEMMNWSARRDMHELWIFFIAAFIVHDSALRPNGIFHVGGKWAMIGLIAILLYFKEIDFIVTDDKFALLAGMSVLPAILVPVLFFLYLVLVWLLKRRLKHGFSHSREIPTLPVLTISLILSVFILYLKNLI